MRAPDPNVEPIRDEALATAARDHRGVNAESTRADLADLTSVAAPGCGIRTLAGFRRASVLVSLRLEGNALRSLDPVGSMPVLRFLVPDRNPLASIDHLGALTRLRLVRRNDNELADVGFAASLERLIELPVAGNRIDDGAPLVANQDFATNATLACVRTISN